MPAPSSPAPGGSSTAPVEPPQSDCHCSGVRWCARCLDPAVRRRRRMDDPLPPPPLLESVFRGGTSSPARLDHPSIHGFDLSTQHAPGLPGFRGLRVYRELLDEAEARALLAAIDAEPWRGAQSGKQKQHYGPRINFNKRRMNAADYKGIPGWAHRLEARVRTRIAAEPPAAGAEREALEAALAGGHTTDVFVLRYRPDQASNLDFHVDDVFAYGELILDVSLESDAVLTFLQGRPGSEAAPLPDGTLPAEPACIRVPLPARSVAVLYGEARHHWEHAMLAGDIRARRTSITLRTLGATLKTSEAGARVAAIAAANRATDDARPKLPRAT